MDSNILLVFVCFSFGFVWKSPLEYYKQANITNTLILINICRFDQLVGWLVERSFAFNFNCMNFGLQGTRKETKIQMSERRNKNAKDFFHPLLKLMAGRPSYWLCVSHSVSRSKNEQPIHSHCSVRMFALFRLIVRRYIGFIVCIELCIIFIECCAQQFNIE